MDLIVTGSRFGHPDVDRWLDALLKRRGEPRVLYEGGARGVDEQARSWARRNAVKVETVHADWSDGSCAGPDRNRAMVAMAKKPCVLVAFPDTSSKGTWDCYLRGVEAGLECHFAPAVRWEKVHEGVARWTAMSREATLALRHAYERTWKP